MNVDSNIKRAENIPARDNNEFNRFYPANKTLCKYTSFFAFRNCFSHENNIKRLSAFFISISSTLYWMNFFLSHFIARSI